MNHADLQRQSDIIRAVLYTRVLTPPTTAAPNLGSHGVVALPRQQLLGNAQQDLSAYRVAALFNQFTQFNPAAVQPAVKPTPQVPEDQIQPGQSRAGGDVVQPSSQLRTWSSVEISAFYKDKAAGKYSQADAAALEADIFAAQKQGRITA